mmetsp:Transcript_22139/g.75935  ORF Transcript_22139/g.75935 Transcript_22139/m.75935 type:complete len:407 (+) Transcript_22139:1093-2313(+)
MQDSRDLIARKLSANPPHGIAGSLEHIGRGLVRHIAREAGQQHEQPFGCHVVWAQGLCQQSGTLTYSMTHPNRGIPQCINEQRRPSRCRFPRSAEGARHDVDGGGPVQRIIGLHRLLGKLKHGRERRRRIHPHKHPHAIPRGLRDDAHVVDVVEVWRLVLGRPADQRHQSCNILFVQTVGHANQSAKQLQSLCVAVLGAPPQRRVGQNAAGDACGREAEVFGLRGGGHRAEGPQGADDELTFGWIFRRSGQSGRRNFQGGSCSTFPMLDAVVSQAPRRSDCLDDRQTRNLHANLIIVQALDDNLAEIRVVLLQPRTDGIHQGDEQLQSRHTVYRRLAVQKAHQQTQEVFPEQVVMHRDLLARGVASLPQDAQDSRFLARGHACQQRPLNTAPVVVPQLLPDTRHPP